MFAPGLGQAQPTSGSTASLPHTRTHTHTHTHTHTRTHTPTPSANLPRLRYKRDGGVHPGVNITNCRGLSVLGAAIDYLPKSRALFCLGRWPDSGPPGPPRLVHGNASINEMEPGTRLWCGRHSADDCHRGLRAPVFECPTATECQSACAGNQTCLGATWTGHRGRSGGSCTMVASLHTVAAEQGFASWSRVPVPQQENRKCGPPSGPGITLHMFNSERTVVEDLTIHAAPYMAITSFNGEGGHVLRRVKFAPNEQGQVIVAERDGVHESDVRHGMALEDSTIGFLNDDFMNVHSTMLVVLRCNITRCLLINPHVETGPIDTTYALNSLLEGARAGDLMSFFPLLPQGPVHANTPLTPLSSSVVVRSASRETDPALIQEALSFAKQLSANTSLGVKQFAGSGHPVDLWSVEFASTLPRPIPSATLATVDEIGSAGARFVRNHFQNTSCSARWKSSNAVIADNTFANAFHNLEITYLQSYLEGPALISNISIVGNTFYYGEGVNPIHPNPIDTTEIVERNNQFLPAERYLN